MGDLSARYRVHLKINGADFEKLAAPMVALATLKQPGFYSCCNLLMLSGKHAVPPPPLELSGKHAVPPLELSGKVSTLCPTSSSQVSMLCPPSSSQVGMLCTPRALR